MEVWPVFVSQFSQEGLGAPRSLLSRALFGEVSCQLRRIVLRNEEEDPHWMEVGVGRFPLGQLYRGDAKGPDVGLGVIS